jgi:uncharacterized membrane protein HdeD (DUF308 family)
MSQIIVADRSRKETGSQQRPPRTPPRVVAVRAVLALTWAAALVLVIGDDVPRTSSDVPVAAAALLASYPVIDVVASLVGAAAAGPAGRVLRLNAAISAIAVAAIATTAFGSDAGATLAVFGTWAAVSGAIQLGVAVHHRAHGSQLSMIVSGGLSTIAGLSFVFAAGMDDAHLAHLAGYMGLGALLFLVFAFRARATPASPS